MTVSKNSEKYFVDSNLEKFSVSPPNRWVYRICTEDALYKSLITSLKHNAYQIKSVVFLRLNCQKDLYQNNDPSENRKFSLNYDREISIIQ